MAGEKVNKVVYGGNVLIDLTEDDVTLSDVRTGVKFHLPDGTVGTGTNTNTANPSDGTATAAEVLATKTFYAGNATKKTGTMPNRGGVTGTITTKAGEYTIQQGYHDGSGKVSIASSEQSKIVATNIREGITILGVTGTMSGQEDVHAQAKTVTPSTSSQTITPDTPTYNYLSQVTVSAIPYAEVVNDAGGLTVTIG